MREVQNELFPIGNKFSGQFLRDRKENLLQGDLGCTSVGSSVNIFLFFFFKGGKDAYRTEQLAAASPVSLLGR